MRDKQSSGVCVCVCILRNFSKVCKINSSHLRAKDRGGKQREDKRKESSMKKDREKAEKE